MVLKCGFLKTCLVFSSHFDFKCQIHSTNTSKRLYLEHEICIDTEPGAVVIIGIFLNCHLHQQTSASYCQQPTSAAYRIQHGLARLLHSFLLSIQVVQCELLYVSAASGLHIWLWENSSCTKRNSSGLNQHRTNTKCSFSTTSHFNELLAKVCRNGIGGNNTSGSSAGPLPWKNLFQRDFLYL